jgi:protein disulfide-isomerase
MMKTVTLVFALLVVLTTAPLPAQITWHTDYTYVRTLSQQGNKPMLLLFNGSDWSGEAMWMKHEILSTEPFEEKIANRFVCMEVDFPEHSALAEKKEAQNKELKSRFHIQEIPTLLLLDAQERIIAQIAYLPEGGSQFANDLLKILEQDALLVQGLKTLHGDPIQLKNLYQIAQELGQEIAQEQVLAAGLQTEDPYFFLEKYRLLVEKGEKDRETTQTLRSKLATLDPENAHGVHFTLALVDYQELSQKEQSPDKAVAPLVAYLERFGQKDRPNLWRIEMMIAQHYMEADVPQKALQHAEKALQAAPDQMRGEIAHSLDYIRATSAPP